MVAASAAALLRSNGTDAEIAARPALRTPDRIWTHGEVYAEACRYATLFQERLPAGRPPHVGVLLDNIPEYLFAFGGAALIGAAVVGLNHTRQGEHLLRDLHHADVGLVITEPAHGADLDPIRSDLGLPAESVLLAGPELEAALPADAADLGHRARPRHALGADLHLGDVVSAQGGDLHAAPAPRDRQPHADDHGPRARRRRLRLHAAVPLQRGEGGLGAVDRGRGVGRPGPALQRQPWLPDIRRYGATYFNYTGKPLGYLLASPEQPDDADNPLRVAFGNEGSPDVVERFARRFGVEVIDAYGATEGGVAVNRDGGHAGRRARSGRSRRCKVVDEDGNEKPVARLDADGRLLNAEECVGEIVNTAGSGPFEGYYNNAEANDEDHPQRLVLVRRPRLPRRRRLPLLRRAQRRLDPRRRRELPGRADRGRAWSDTPTSSLAAVYGVPDEQAGDQVMATVVVRDGVSLDPADLAELDRRPGATRSEVAAPVRAGRPGAADHGDEQDRQADLALQKFRVRPGRRRPRLARGTGARWPTGRSPPTTRRSSWPT